MQRIEDDLIPFGFTNTTDEAQETSFFDGEDTWKVTEESENVDPFNDFFR